MPVKPRSNGFGLIEALVAAAILASTCLGLAAIVMATQRVEKVTASRATLAQSLLDERARLATLPYFAQADVSLPGAPWQASPPSLLGEVFPWASAVAMPTVGSYRSEDGIGVFTTVRRAGSVTIVREARFVRLLGESWVGIADAELGPWAVEKADTLPAAAVQVVMTATANGMSSTLVASFTALPPAIDLP